MIQKKLITPFQKFVRIESFSGILLFIATVVALIWVNTPLREYYHALWQFEVGINTDAFTLTKPVILWINDGLMAVFFFLIGLEIKREVLIGELNSPKKAAFPFFGALGGMLFPTLCYILLNDNPETANGWGIPMATDIAFALAVLTLLGDRVPLSLKIFLTAFAIVDDIGAVIVIALFYSSGIHWTLLAYAAPLLIVLYGLAYLRIYTKYAVVILGLIIWVIFLKSGIHPTVAGVLLALAIPIRQRIGVATFTKGLDDIVDRIQSSSGDPRPILSKEQIAHIDNLEDWTSKVQSPLQQMERSLHNWVAYFIMPVFALANAGVVLTGTLQLDSALVILIAVCLIAGNFIGVTTMSFLGVKLKLVEIPGDIRRAQIFGIAFIAGIGFTMSIFVANLAFARNPEFIDSAKVGILVGSLISGLVGYTILRFSGGKRKYDGHLNKA